MAQRQGFVSLDEASKNYDEQKKNYNNYLKKLQPGFTFQGNIIKSEFEKVNTTRFGNDYKKVKSLGNFMKSNTNSQLEQIKEYDSKFDSTKLGETVFIYSDRSIQAGQIAIFKYKPAKSAANAGGSYRYHRTKKNKQLKSRKVCKQLKSRKVRKHY